MPKRINAIAICAFAALLNGVALVPQQIGPVNGLATAGGYLFVGIDTGVVRVAPDGHQTLVVPHGVNITGGLVSTADSAGNVYIAGALPNFSPAELKCT